MTWRFIMNARTSESQRDESNTENGELTTNNWFRFPGYDYTGTRTLSTISWISCSACSDFFSVEE